MNDLISVVITSYGRTDTLSRAIESVKNQTYSNIEIIIVDDNSDEVCASKIDNICDSFNDSRIVVIHNATNLGGALARNEGIKAANGEYVAFLDDDDEYLPQKIEKQYQLFKEKNDPKLALVYCYCEEIKHGRLNHIYKNDIVGNCVYEGMLDCIAATSQWMCKKNALLKVQMFTDTPCKQDSFLICKLLVNGYKLDRVAEILSVYNVGSVNTISTGSHAKRIEGECKLRDYCREKYGLLSSTQIQEVEYRFSCRLVEHYYGINNKQKGFYELKRVLKHPFRIQSLKAIKRTIVGGIK